jgi:hypothetical protein
VTAGRPGPVQNSEKARSDQEYSALSPFFLSGLNATHRLAMRFHLKFSVTRISL